MFCLKEAANPRDTKNMKSNAEIAIEEFRKKVNVPFRSVSAHKLEDNMTLEQVVSQFRLYIKVLLM